MTYTTGSRCVLGFGGADDLETASGSDTLLGGDGDDDIQTGKGSDAALGGQGDDRILLFESKKTELHDNLAHGGEGDDVIVAAAGNDVLFGNEGDDLLEGNDGDDEFIPGPGVDDARGGAGDDVFVIESLCEVTVGDTFDGGPGFDVVRSPYSQDELEAAGLTLTSIEAFKTIIPTRLGNGACALLELAQDPDPTCVAHLGYDTRTSSSTPPYSVGIRHPDGRRAQVDADMDTPLTTVFSDSNPLIEANVRYPDGTKAFFNRSLGESGDIGWLEGGASGGALFDNHARVIGCLSGHIGAGSGCVNVVDCFDGRLAVAYDTSVDEQTELSAIFNSVTRDPPTSTFSDPFPLSANSSTLTPCLGQSAHFVINPLVDDEVHVEWFVDSAPGQIVGNGTGELYDYPQHKYWRSIHPTVVNPNGPEPPITIRIETHFGPGHPDCARTSREFVVQPVECI